MKARTLAASTTRYLYCDGSPKLLFTENETNTERLFGDPNATPFVKDGINNCVVHGQTGAVNPQRFGTKVAAQYVITVGARESQMLRLRLSDATSSGALVADAASVGGEVTDAGSVRHGHAVLPNVVTYNTLFSKDVGDRLADDILHSYWESPFHPEAPVLALFSQFRKKGRDDQALQIALSYPHNDVIIKFIRDNSEKAIKHFEMVWNWVPNHPNAAYALGIALMEAENNLAAQPYLDEALKLATSDSRKSDIRKRLALISDS